MTEFIFINPSPNMEIIAKAVQDTGRSVMRIVTKEYVNMRPDSMWIFIDGNGTNINEKKMFSEIDSNVSNLKKPFFPSFKYRYINRKLSEAYPSIKAGNFQDYVLLTEQFWRDADLPVEVSDMSFNEVVSKYPLATVVTSKVPAASGKYAMTLWRSDFDVREALGNDYFFFFDGINRYELFCSGEELATIGYATEKLDWLKRINPTMERFAFEKKSSIAFYQNRNPWIIKHSSNIFLLNDYSWQGLSIKLPDSWVKAVRKIICEDKKKR